MDYVLPHFDDEQLLFVEESMGLASEAIEAIIVSGKAKGMNLYNQIEPSLVVFLICNFIKRVVNLMRHQDENYMINQDKMIFTIIAILILCFPVMSLGQNCYDYENTTDEVKAKIIFDNKLHSEFFDSHETSYPWYIIKNDDGTFESALNREITKEDKILIEHTSNCVSTHQGKHIMNFCDATYTLGVLQLEIYGGMPAYSSSLMITIKDSEFLCHFRAAYPAPVSNCKWYIMSKELIFKSNDIKKGKRLYAWISVKFEETSTYQGKTTTNKYKIEGYLKPVVK